MGSWTIYNKNGVAKAVVKELELHDEWMAECFLTLTIKSATPIQFGVGDYLDYRGERYTIEYDPNVIKRATSGTYGEGFVYDGIKFVGSQDEIVRCDFNDIVLSDNNVHYTALPTFPFYCESVDDLLDRIQANLEDLYPNQWIVIGLNTVRNSQRGSAVGRQTAFENAYKKWIDPDMTPHTDPYGKQSVAESADNITCWDALAKVHEDFGLNFIVRGKVVVVGTAGVFTANTFQYGKGNGLEEIEKVGDSSQQIVTRLRAYGSETNLPLHYYSAINMLPYGNVVAASATGLFQIDVAFKKEYFVHEFSSGETDVVVKVGDVSYNAKAYINSITGNININIQTAVSVAANAKVYITEGVKRDMWPNDHKDYSQDALPENMAVSRLMLPMFPNQSLYDWVKAHRDAGTEYDDTTGLATYHGITAYFSKEPHRPYIDSLNKAQYGVRPASIYFDGSNETEDIHPTIEGMTYNNVRVDAVYAADQIEDNGVYDDSSVEVPNFHITLPDLGFNLAEVYEENASIDMKDGMCGGRSFKLAAKPTQDSNGRWVCEVQREKDDNLNLFFPYCDFQISSGDHYVLTGIQMPDAYIEAAAVKLLGAALDALQKNEAPRFTYQPKIDKNFMQRQHDTAMSSQGVVSLHDTLKAGDVFVFADADMGVDASIIIDVLTIKENGDNGIPTYEVTLRDEKQVSIIQKIQNKIDSVINGAININSGVGGLTAQQVRSLINNYGGEQFLSKLNNDTAAGYITMLKGLQVGAKFVPDILGEGGVLRMRQDGKVELVTDILYARVKAYFDSVEIREYQHTGGNRIASVAGNKICRVAWFNSSNVELEQTQANLSSVAYFRCYFRASDGEDTVRNNWVIGDLAYCHVTSIVNSSDNPEQKGLNQKHLWRLVIGRNTEGTLTEDGEAYIDLSNRATETISDTSYTGYQSGSDAPEAQDDIIQLGNVNDTTRQGAIVEFVTGTDAPSYQIYQGINSFSLNNKNQIGFGYNTSTGRAYLNVYGDAYVGARDRSTFIEYKQSGTGGNPELNIKAHVEFTNSDAELDALVQEHQRDDSYDDTEVRGLINGLQEQIDGQVESWFFDYPPVHVDEHGAPDSKVPLNVAPYSDWTDDNAKIAHLGDTFTDNSSGYCWRFTRNENTNAFEWTPIEDSAIISALQNAARAQDTADHKRRVFLTQPVPPYDAGDMWANAVYPANYTGATDEAQHKYNNDILKCVTSKASDGSFSINDWTLASKYTDDSKFNGYIDAMLNGTGLSGDSAAATAQKAILSALGVGTVVAGGLLLSSLIGMRQYNGSGDKSDVSNYTTWAGISGQYNANVLGGGMAAWYGGGMVDKETLTTEQIAQGWDTLRWAKGVDRFDGSGYRADGNISWNENGALTIKNITTLSDSNNNNILNELATFNSAFTFGTSGQGSTTALYITPNVPFESLYIGTSNANKKEVATQEWVGNNYVSTAFFRQLFRAFKPNETAGQVDVEVEPNTIDNTISNIKAMVGFWTEQYVSALGNNSDGGGGGVSVLYGLNDVTPNATGDGVMGAQDGYVLTYNGTTNHWYAAATAETYVLPQATANALGGIKIGYAASGKNYAITLDANGKAYVNVPWTDHYDWGDITNTPTTIAGYGITDAYTKTEVDSLARLESVAFSSDGVLAFTLQDGSVSYIDLTHQHDFQEILERPTTLAGFGIDDAKIESGVITLGNNTITPVTSVAMTVPTGFSISGTPISKTGTLALSYSSGYEGFTTELKNMITALYSWFEIDSNGDIKTKDYTSNGTTKHRGFWSPSFISALGQGSDSGGGGQGDVTWELLQTQATDDRYIHLSYISAALESYLTTNNYVQSSDISDMATKTWVGNQGYLTQQSLSSYYTKSEVDALARLTNVAYSSDGILAFTHQDGSTTYADFTHEHSFLELLDRPTTIAGYEISDVYINNGVVYIGDNSITPVTSVAMTVPTGFSISGSPISKTGTLAVSYASGYEGFTTSLKEKIEALFSWFELDSDGNVKTKDYVDNGTTKHRGFWSESFISALGEGNDGGGGGQGDVTWALLASTATGGRTIDISYLTAALNGYATQSWVQSQGYITQAAVDVLEFLNTVTGGSDILTLTTNKGNSTIVDFTHNHEFLELTDRPTTIAGYGIEDAKIVNGVITLGTNTITPLTSHQSVTNNNISVTWDTETTIATIGSTAIKIKIPANPDTNTWRNIFKDGTEQLTTGINTKGLNFIGDGKTTITFLAAGTGSGQSGNANYATLKIGSTWRGIQDNLISDSTTDSLSAKQGKTLKGYTDTLFGYFTNGVANSAEKLATARSLWGQSFDGTANVSGNMTGVGNITMSANDGTYIKIGDIYIGYDSTNSAIEIYKLGDNNTHVAANLYALGAISALGQGIDGGGGGQGDVTWTLLADNTDTRQVALSHLTDALSGYSTTGHTHTTTIATDSGTNQLTLAYGTKYKITAGGTSFIFTMPSADDTNTWRNIYVAGTEKIGSAVNTKGLNFAAGSNVSLSFTAAGSGTGQNANYGTITISATDTTYSVATQSANGLMSAADKTKLDGLEYFNAASRSSDGVVTLTTNKSNTTILDLTHQHSFLEIVDRPTTVAGYGITDMGSQSVNYATSAGSVAWTNVSSRPTKLSQFTNDSGYITSSGSCSYATSAGAVAWGNVSSKPSNLFCYQGEVSTAYVNGTTYSTLGSGTYYVQLSGYSDSLIHFQHGGSSSGLDIKFNYNQSADAPLYYRKCIDSNRFAGTDWVALIDSLNIGSQSVNYATSAGSASSAGYATSAGSATNDSDGNAINSTYVKISAAQTITGEKTFNAGKWILAGSENDEITNKYWGDGTLYKNDDSGTLGGSLVSIKNAIRFRWYNSYWNIGNIRSDSSASYGFGIALENDAGTHLLDCLRVTKDGTYVSGTLRSLSAGSDVISGMFLCYPTSPYGLEFWMKSTGVGCIQCQREANASEVFPISLNPNGGNVGIGTVSPSYRLHVESNNYPNLYMHSTSAECSIYLVNYNNYGWAAGVGVWSSTIGANSFGIGCYTHNSQCRFYIDTSGNATAIGGVTALSDARHKKVVRDTNLSVEQIANMPSVIFKWTDGKHDDKLHAGSLAQNWRQVLPEVVLEAPDKEHTLSLSYGVAALVAAITTARKVVDHEKEIAQLKNRVKALEDENEMLKTKLIA